MNELQSQELAQERTLFALERTFSAWLRTGLAAIGGGFAITKAIVFKTYLNQMLAYAIGHILIFWGAYVFIFAAYDYHYSYQKLHLRKGLKSKLRIGATLLPLLLVALLVLVVSFYSSD